MKEFHTLLIFYFILYYFQTICSPQMGLYFLLGPCFETIIITLFKKNY